MFKSIAIAALALAAPPALARQDVAPSAHVTIADLDLSAPAGTHQLDRRLAAAVRHVCPRPENPDLRTAMEQRGCVTAAARTADRERARAIGAAHPAFAQVATTAR